MRRYRRTYKVKQREGSRFLALDGEGVGSRYILLGTASDAIASPHGLSSEECIDFLRAQCKPGRIPVVFGLGYDVAHWAADLPDGAQLALWRGERVGWGDLTMRYIPRKLLTLSWPGRRVTIFDVQSFFGSTFEKALETHLGEVPDIIREGKAGRADFETWDPAAILAYNRAECAALERLMERLADTLETHHPDLPDLLPRSWHGPGAVAARVLRSVEAGREVWPERKYPDDLREAFTRAYFGGRIETYGAGTVRGPVWRYDIRSAYPEACRHLPRLKWRWQHLDAFRAGRHFALWRVRWDLRPFPQYADLPGPFPWRDERGYVIFRAEGEGWYWQPEVEAALRHYSGVEVLEGWLMPHPYTYPLRELVERLYRVRRSLVAKGDPRQYAVKIALNSLYGKMAQKAGSARYRSIAWAGYVTAWTRSRMLEAVLQDPHSVLGVMTDGLLTTRRLDLPQGSELGAWERETHDGALILLPGVYRLGRVDSESRVERWRGYNVRGFPWAAVVREVRARGSASIPCPLFVSPALAILAPHAYGEHRRCFITQDRAVTPLVSHKRRYRVPEDGNGPPRADLARRWVATDLVASPPDEWPGLSAPYQAFALDPVEEAIRSGLEEAGGLPAPG
jgi:hypothetical protein